MERWNRLHPARAGEAARTFWRRCEGAAGPIVAATDYMKAVPDQLAPWLSEPPGHVGHGRLRAQRQPRASAAALRGERRVDCGCGAVAAGARRQVRCAGGAESNARSSGSTPRRSIRPSRRRVLIAQRLFVRGIRLDDLAITAFPSGWVVRRFSAARATRLLRESPLQRATPRCRLKPTQFSKVSANAGLRARTTRRQQEL